MSDLLHRNPISVSAICAATFLGVSAMTTTAAADPAQAFGAIDSDGDGTISLDEYLTASEPVAAIAMNSDGSDARMISRYEARRLLKQNYREYDENRDGRVDEREFMPRFDLTSRMSFYTVDQNGDGKIELDELLAFSTGASAEVARLEDVFARLDGNQNGAITLQEYQIVRL
ncbi:MAG: EF-hand domain-containing protein [Pseudomonadota bacterium]